ncbi:MAG: lytic transglycosylase domain-containing protein, partial [Sphingomonas bacterium]|nr:lytic transglycosylase domain-containing protein [Sphingomonas bacterium]
MMRGLMILMLASASPAFAQQDPLAPVNPPLPSQPTPADQAGSVHDYVAPRAVPTDWRGVFAAIRGGDWYGAERGVAALPDGPLKPVAKAELFTAKASPRVELAPLLALLAEAPDLPQADQVQRMAMARGALDPPPVVGTHATVGLGVAPRRGRAKAVSGEPAADALRAALQPLVEIDDAPGAEALLTASAPMLSAEARAEAAQRVAWIYYVLGRDTDTRRVADLGRIGASGEWAAQAAWVSGLAAWRMNDC